MEMLFFFSPAPMGTFLFSILGLIVALIVFAVIVGALLVVAFIVIGAVAVLYDEICKWSKKTRRTKNTQ